MMHDKKIIDQKHSRCVGRLEVKKHKLVFKHKSKAKDLLTLTINNIKNNWNICNQDLLKMIIEL